MYICSVAETYFFQFHNHYPKIIYWTCLFSHSLKTLLTYFWRTKYTCSGCRTPLFWLLSFYIWHPVEYPFPLFFSEIFLAISVYFLFQMNFRLNMSSSIKNPFGILIGSALNLQINLGRIDIFTLLNLPIQEHGMPLHFFRCSFISFSKVLMVFFFSCRS